MYFVLPQTSEQPQTTDAGSQELTSVQQEFEDVENYYNSQDGR